MAFDTPVWVQGGSYDAKADRTVLAAVWAGDGVIDITTHHKVTQRAAGANMTVDIAPGISVVAGDDVPNQGVYLCQSTAVESASIDPAPSTGQSRIDLIAVKVSDGAAVVGGTNTASIVVVKGTAAATGSQVPPTLPASHSMLASILIPSGTASILDSAITDQRAPARAAKTTAWASLTLASTWSNVGSPYELAQYRRNGDRVEVRGVVAGGDASHQIIGTLPAGYRPVKTAVRACFADVPGFGSPAATRLDVASDGTITVAVPTTGITWGYIAIDLSFSTV